MPLLIETLRADDGRFDDLWPHVERMDRSRRELFGIEAGGGGVAGDPVKPGVSGRSDGPGAASGGDSRSGGIGERLGGKAASRESSRALLEEALKQAAGLVGEGRWKVRVVYDRELRSVEAAAYKAKPIQSAALVDGRGIRYAHKTADRSELDALSRRAEASAADTALIVSDGLITDFPYANAAFFDGSRWWTPAEPLLRGTRRARLLEAGLITSISIRPGDLGQYKYVSPINAMLELGEIMVDINSINREII